jgi:hypothetical protein
MLKKSCKYIGLLSAHIKRHMSTSSSSNLDIQFKNMSAAFVDQIFDTPINSINTVLRELIAPKNILKQNHSAMVSKLIDEPRLWSVLFDNGSILMRKTTVELYKRSRETTALSKAVDYHLDMINSSKINEALTYFNLTQSLFTYSTIDKTLTTVDTLAYKRSCLQSYLETLCNQYELLNELDSRHYSSTAHMIDIGTSINRVKNEIGSIKRILFEKLKINPSDPSTLTESCSCADYSESVIRAYVHDNIVTATVLENLIESIERDLKRFSLENIPNRAQAPIINTILFKAIAMNEFDLFQRTIDNIVTVYNSRAHLHGQKIRIVNSVLRLYLRKAHKTAEKSIAALLDTLIRINSVDLSMEQFYAIEEFCNENSIKAGLTNIDRKYEFFVFIHS